MKHNASPSPMVLKIPFKKDDIENSKITFITPAIPTNATSRAQSVGNLWANRCDIFFDKNEFPLFTTCNEQQAENNYEYLILLLGFYHPPTTTLW